MKKAFEAELDNYLDDVIKFYEEDIGYKKAVTLRAKRKDTPPKMRFEWPYYRHFEGKKYCDIAKLYDEKLEKSVDEQQIQQRVQELIDLIGLPNSD